MSEFAPCSSCQRHVRVGDHACPFCGAARLGAARSATVAAGTKRAVMFALGVSLAAGACVEAEEDEQGNTAPTATQGAATTSTPTPTNVQAIYGAPVPPASTPHAMATQAIYGAPVPPTASAKPSGPNIQPLYGAPIPAPSNSASAAPKPTGPNIQPVYGAPIPTLTTKPSASPLPTQVVAVYGAPPPPKSSASAPTSSSAAPKPSSGMFQPAYGVVPAPIVPEKQ